MKNNLCLDDQSTIIIKSFVSLSSDDEAILTKCYLPIIGMEAYSLYHIFLFNKNDDGYMTFERLYNITNLSKKDILKLSNYIHNLEAVGLLATYFKEIQTKYSTKPSYIFKLFRPLNGTNFFKNILLQQALISKIGPRQVRGIIQSLKINEDIPNSYSDISVKFNDVFDIDDLNYKDYEEFSNNLEKLKGDDVSQVEVNFDKDNFLKILSENQINLAYIEPYLDEIVRLSCLFGVSSKSAANQIINKSLDSYNNFHLDNFENFAKNYLHYHLEREESENKSNLIGSSEIANRIKMMVSYSPKMYLQMLIDNELPNSYINLLDELSKKYKVPNEIINASLDYTMQRCHNTIPNDYVIKVCLTLLKEKIYIASDAVSYLYQSNSNYITNKRKKETKIDSAVNKISLDNDNQVDNKSETSDTPKESEIDFNKLLGGLI